MSVQAQTWPTKPVRLVVPFAPGGGVDAIARTFSVYLSRMWGQPVIVDNRPGAGGQIAAQIVANAEPDGMTLLVASSSLAAAPALFRRLNYDPVQDLAPVSMLVDAPSLMVVNPAFPAKSVSDFLALARAQPGKINYGSTGVGSGPNLAMELFKSLTGIDIVHVPYKGEAPMYSALFANEIQVSILASQAGAPLVKAGRLRALAVTAKTRNPFLPEVPDMAESGVKEYEYRPWIGIFAPAKTPVEVVNKINADTVAVLGEEKVKTKSLPEWGSQATPGTADAFKKRYLSDIEMYKRIVQDSSIPQED